MPTSLPPLRVGDVPQAVHDALAADGAAAARAGLPDDPPHPRASRASYVWLLGWRDWHRRDAAARAYRAWLG